MADIVPLLTLLIIAIIVVIVSTRIRFPYTAALVLLGAAIGLLGQRFGPLASLRADETLFSTGFFFNVLLPPIIFEAAIHIDFRQLRARAPLILFLVFVGVIFTTAFTGLLVSWIAGIPLLVALLLAAILSPTDPIAVVDLFRRLKVPSELATIVESESLLNDAVGVITFLVILGLLTGGGWSAAGVTLQFVQLTFGGIAIGLLAAGGVYVLHRHLNDPAVETALSIVVAYGSFLAAQSVGASGIIATSIAGIAVGTWIAPRAMDAAVQHTVSTFWGVIIYVVNSIIFLSMGLLVAVSNLPANLFLIALVFATLVLGRGAFVYVHRPLATALRGPGARLPASWYNVLTMAGIRGAIPVVLALSLVTSSAPLSAGLESSIASVVIGVALASVVAGNLVADWYVRRTFGAREATELADEEFPPLGSEAP